MMNLGKKILMALMVVTLFVGTINLSYSKTTLGKDCTSCGLETDKGLSDKKRAKGEHSEFTQKLFILLLTEGKEAVYRWVSAVLDTCYKDQVYFHAHGNLTEAITSLISNMILNIYFSSQDMPVPSYESGC